jgi:hypothetical protein
LFVDCVEHEQPALALQVLRVARAWEPDDESRTVLSSSSFSTSSTLSSSTAQQHVQYERYIDEQVGKFTLQVYIYIYIHCSVRSVIHTVISILRDCRSFVTWQYRVLCLALGTRL